MGVVQNWVTSRKIQREGEALGLPTSFASRCVAKNSRGLPTNEARVALHFYGRGLNSLYANVGSIGAIFDASLVGLPDTVRHEMCLGPPPPSLLGGSDDFALMRFQQLPLLRRRGDAAERERGARRRIVQNHCSLPNKFGREPT